MPGRRRRRAVPTLAAANGLAAALLTQGEREAASERYQDTLARCRRLLDAAHPETVAALNGCRQERPTPQVGPLHQQGAELCGRLPVGQHPQHLAAGNGIAQVMLLQGDPANAATELATVLDGCVARYGEQDPEAAAARRNLDRLRRPATPTPTAEGE